jgi:hypothetical protein
MADEHARAVKAGLRTNAELKKLFDGLGNEEHPRGAVLSAYRVARKALRGELKDVAAAQLTLAHLRRAVLNEVGAAAQQAVQIGSMQATAELELYGIQRVSEVSLGDFDLSVVDDALRAVGNVLDTQLNAVWALVRSDNVDDSLILGDDARAGLLRPSSVIQEATRWLAFLALSAYSSLVERSAKQSGIVFKRQAVAALDERTTDCCLRVHGQVVGLNEDFKLTGTPRYADRMRNPPFHPYCRTAVVLVRDSEKDDDLTMEMRDAARAEIQARAQTGTRVEIHPAHATSRRG